MSNLSECRYFEIRTKLYKIPEFAALWCGIPEEELNDFLDIAYPIDNTALGNQILSHEDYPCLQIKCRYICNAIQDGALVTFNEKGKLQPLETEEHTAWGRKHLRGDKALDWIRSTDMTESDIPKFLIKNVKNQIDEADCNPRSRNTLFKLIIGLADLYHINLAEPGLTASLEAATKARDCKLPRSTADQLLREIAEFEKNFAN